MVVRRPYPPPRPYGARTAIVAPVGVGSALPVGILGAIGGTLGCLLCLAAIGALGLFSCVVAITAYAKKFLNAYKHYWGINGAGREEICYILLIASLMYAIVCRMQRC